MTIIYIYIYIYFFFFGCVNLNNLRTQKSKLQKKGMKPFFFQIPKAKISDERDGKYFHKITHKSPFSYIMSPKISLLIGVIYKIYILRSYF